MATTASPLERAAVEREIVFAGFEDVKAGIVKWPMSVIRLRCGKKARLVELADKILLSWRGYTDEDAFIFAETEGVPHNTITPSPAAGERTTNWIWFCATTSPPKSILWACTTPTLNFTISRRKTSVSLRLWAWLCCLPA